MRLLVLVIFLLPVACKSLTDHEKKIQALTGDWIVLYPDHQLRNQRQRDIYRKMQDSIVGEAGLKLIRLSANGQFQQMDSLKSQGSWELEENNELIISNGGKGFNYLKATFKDYSDKELEIVENVATENEKIRLVWHWKKIEDSDAGSDLFDEGDNSWRIQPTEKENDEQIKERLQSMLIYYSRYYKVVSAEASYFIGDRVLLPFKFYQNAVGLRPFDPLGKFGGFFYDQEDAMKAYKFLDRSMGIIRSDGYPSGKDFVEEYAMVMEKLSEQVVKLK